MSAASEEIVVALGFDARYAAHAAATIASAARATRTPLRFLLLHAGVDSATQALVERAAPQSRCDWIEVGEDDVPPFADRSHFTRATLFRLGLERLAPPACRRLIYLDCDLVVVEDLAPLWRTDLGGRALGAVADENVDALEFAGRWRLAPGPGYFNAGVLLIDLEAVRRTGLFSSAIAFLAANGAALPWNDQDALNWACWGGWLPLATSWNVQRSTAIAGRAGAPRVVHFTGAEKPWIRGAYHPWSWLYWRALAATPFGRQIGGPAQRLRDWLRWQRRRPRQSGA